MDKIQINITTPIQTLQELSDFTMVKSGSSVMVIFNQIEDIININEGDELMFKRYLYREDKSVDILECELTVQNVDYPNKSFLIPFIEPEFIPIEEIYVSNTNSGNTIIELFENHDVFFQDNQDNPITFYDNEFNKIYPIDPNEECVGHNLTLYSHDPFLEDIFLTSYYDLEDCDETRVYNYSFLPELVSRKRLLISGVTAENIDGAKYVSFKFNPFYWYNNNGVCATWSDVLYNNFPNYNVNFGNESHVELVKRCDYWETKLGLDNDSNETELGSEDSFGHKMLDEIVEELIPDIIDMERLKYQPIVFSDGIIQMATELNFYFHFRKRKELGNNINARLTENSPLTSGNVYYDTWIVDEDAEDTWWNGYNNDGSEIFSSSAFTNFFNNSGKKSDLLGYLNFTNNDVFYRKKKVSKTFIRLSFYTSKDPIEQKLLYYSTIFFDGGELYGKYLKQYLHLKEEERRDTAPDFTSKVDDDGYPEHVKVVFSDGPSDRRVDSKITVTNEYNRLASSEGYNIYLFAEDQKVLKEGLENTGKTIYMKIEFNHAGNGKTIPMIMWPKDENGVFVPLNIDNFLDSLYIPVNLHYIENEGRYVYTIPGTENATGGMDLILFEPKLDEMTSEEADKEKDNEVDA